jgi:hypothetical protein
LLAALVWCIKNKLFGCTKNVQLYLCTTLPPSETERNLENTVSVHNNSHGGDEKERSSEDNQ